MKDRDTQVDTMGEKYILETAFRKDGQIRIIHDTIAEDYDSVSVLKYELVCQQKGKTVRLPKIECLLAVPKAKLAFIRPYIKGSVKIRDLNLRGIEEMDKRHKIADLSPCQPSKTYQFALRNGAVFEGILVCRLRYHILVRIGGETGKLCLIWKHAIYAIGNTQQPATKQTRK